MAEESIYQPESAPRRKPGRPSNAEKASALAAAAPDVKMASEQAIPVEEAISADVTLHPEPPQTEESYEQAVERIRKMRTQFGEATYKLALPKRNGYHRHWFNDTPGRIEQANQSGWAHLQDQDGKPLKRVVGSGRHGGPLLAYAMEIPSVFWEEAMAVKHAAAQAKVDSIKKSPFQAAPGTAKASDQGKFYSPTEADPITITRG